jgi:peptidoglycan/xylan/chitin deacetylase (PgdA/CDA1 family)
VRLRGLGRLRRATSKHLGLPKHRGLILLYHRIADMEPDPWSMCVTPENFAQHLAVLRDWGEPVMLRDLPRTVDEAGSRRRPIAVTFDDGYADNLLAARPLLERYDVPATLFACTGHVGGSREFWWDQLERLLLHARPLPTELHVRIRGRRYSWTPSERPTEPGGGFGPRGWRAWEPPPSDRHALYTDLWDVLVTTDEEERTRVLGELHAWTATADAVRPSHRPLSEEELAELAGSPLVTVGAHTVTHSALSALSPERQQREIMESKQRLEALVGRAVTDFAYPFGRRCDYGPDTVSFVREAGFERACSNFAGSVKRASDPWQLPRLQVDNWDGETLARKLDNAVWS